MSFICLNGKIFPAGEPVLHASNRGFKYGDALFETIKVIKGRIPLSRFHFSRLFHGLSICKMPVNGLTEENLAKYIVDLCQENQCIDRARVRLQVFRGADDNTGFIIEATPFNNELNEWAENGLSIDIYEGATKSMDKFSNLKSSNFLPYVMADIFAKENDLDDAIVFNTNGRIADTGRANIFLVKDNQIITPPLSEGGVNGVMRSFLLEKLDERIIQLPVTAGDLSLADEVFLTNAIFGIRWVKSFRDKNYPVSLSRKIYSEWVSTIFH